MVQFHYTNWASIQNVNPITIFILFYKFTKFYIVFIDNLSSVEVEQIEEVTGLFQQKSSGNGKRAPPNSNKKKTEIKLNPSSY